MAVLLAERPGLPVRLEVLKQSQAVGFYRRLGFAQLREQAFDRAMELPPRQ